MRRYSAFHPYSRPDVSTPNSHANGEFSVHSQHHPAAFVHQNLDQPFSEFSVTREPWVPDVLESFSLPLMAPQPSVPSYKTTSAAPDAEKEDCHFRTISPQPPPVTNYAEPDVVTPLTYFYLADYGSGVPASANGFGLLPPTIPADLQEQATANCSQWQPDNTSAQIIGSQNLDQQYYQSETNNEQIPQSKLTITQTGQPTPCTPHSEEVYSSQQQERASFTLKYITRLFQEKFDIYKNMMRSRGMSPESILEMEKHHLQRLQLVACMNPHQIERFWKKCERGVRQAPRASAATETPPSSEINTTFDGKEQFSTSSDHAFAGEQGNDWENSVAYTTQPDSFLPLNDFQDIQGLNEAETGKTGGNSSSFLYFALIEGAPEANSARNSSEDFGQTAEMGNGEMTNFGDDWY